MRVDSQLMLWGVGVILLAVVSMFVSALYRRKESSPRRAIPVFKNLAGEVGRAAEEGSLVHITLGSGSLYGEAAMTSVAALESLTTLADLSAAYDTPPIVTTGDPTLYLLADDWMRRAYSRLGNVGRYRPTLVQFVGASPVAYAAQAATYLYEKGVGSNIMFGAFAQEVSLLSNASARSGVLSVGAATSWQALGALFPALGATELVMGEDLFAGGALVTQRRAYEVALWGEDILRWAVIAGLIVLAMLSALGFGVG
ncbi:MAG: DUF6754 domain-containing protein [Chloroflexota bacterium]|nr:DUF6754 domain-containing protein [Chloroflexota bacterium]